MILPVTASHVRQTACHAQASTNVHHVKVDIMGYFVNTSVEVAANSALNLTAVHHVSVDITGLIASMIVAIAFTVTAIQNKQFAPATKAIRE